jgi:hypothetical protein
MTSERNVAIHEAGHAAVGWYFGMRPTSVSLGSDETGPQTIHDRSTFNNMLPGQGLIRALVNSAITVVQSAAGGCAELRLGTEHEKCGWTGDFMRFEKHLKAISKICGHDYNYCWDFTSAMAKEILAEPEVWTIVEEVAARLSEKRTLSEEELRVIFAGRTAPRRAERTSVLFDFVNTTHAQIVAQSYREGALPEYA